MTTETTEVTDHDEAGRYEVHVDGALAGWADRNVSDGAMVLPHTVVDPRFRGRGLAALLVRQALDDARAAELTVIPSCSYVADFLARHPDDLHLVPAAERARHGL